MPALLAVLNRCERWLVEYWNSKRGDDRPPLRRSIDPLEMWQFLPCLEVHALDDAGRLLCRQSGTEVGKATRIDQTGEYLDEVIAEAAYARRKRLFDRSLAIGRPLLYRAHMPLPGMEWRTYRRLILPLRSRGEQADMALSHLHFERAAGTVVEALPHADMLEQHEMDAAEFVLLEQAPSAPSVKRAC